MADHLFCLNPLKAESGTGKELLLPYTLQHCSRPENIAKLPIFGIFKNRHGHYAWPVLHGMDLFIG